MAQVVSSHLTTLAQLGWRHPITALLRALAGDSLRLVRALLPDDRWIVAFAGTNRLLAAHLRHDRLDVLECFAYWQHDVHTGEQELVFEIGWAIWQTYLDEDNYDWNQHLPFDVDSD